MPRAVGDTLEGLIWRAPHSEKWSLNDSSLKNEDSKVETNVIRSVVSPCPSSGLSVHVVLVQCDWGASSEQRRDTSCRINRQPAPQAWSSGAEPHSGQITCAFLSGRKLCLIELTPGKRLQESESKHRPKFLILLEPSRGLRVGLLVWLVPSVVCALLGFIWGPPMDCSQPDRSL